MNREIFNKHKQNIDSLIFAAFNKQIRDQLHTGVGNVISGVKVSIDENIDNYPEANPGCELSETELFVIEIVENERRTTRAAQKKAEAEKQRADYAFCELQQAKDQIEALKGENVELKQKLAKEIQKRIEAEKRNTDDSFFEVELLRVTVGKLKRQVACLTKRLEEAREKLQESEVRSSETNDTQIKQGALGYSIETLTSLSPENLKKLQTIINRAFHPDKVQNLGVSLQKEANDELARFNGIVNKILQQRGK